jgi:hypothetical protein
VLFFLGLEAIQIIIRSEKFTLGRQELEGVLHNNGQPDAVVWRGWIWRTPQLFPTSIGRVFKEQYTEIEASAGVKYLRHM